MKYLILLSKKDGEIVKIELREEEVEKYNDEEVLLYVLQDHYNFKIQDYYYVFTDTIKERYESN